MCQTGGNFYLVVDLVMDIIAALVTNVGSDVVVIIDTPVAVVPSSMLSPISVTGGTF